MARTISRKRKRRQVVPSSSEDEEEVAAFASVTAQSGSTHSGKDDEAIPDGMESRLRASARAKRSRASPTGSEAGTAAACATATTDGEVTGAGTAISAVHPGIDGRGQRPSQSTAYGSDHGSEMPCTAWSDSVMRRSVRICKKVSLQELSQEEGTDSVHQSEESSDGRLNSGKLANSTYRKKQLIAKTKSLAESKSSSVPNAELASAPKKPGRSQSVHNRMLASIPKIRLATWSARERHLVLNYAAKHGISDIDYESLSAQIRTRTPKEVEDFMTKVVSTVFALKDPSAGPVEEWQSIIDEIMEGAALPQTFCLSEAMLELSQGDFPEPGPCVPNYSVVYRYLAAVLKPSRKLPALGYLERATVIKLLSELSEEFSKYDIYPLVCHLLLTYNNASLEKPISVLNKDLARPYSTQPHSPLKSPTRASAATSSRTVWTPTRPAAVPTPSPSKSTQLLGDSPLSIKSLSHLAYPATRPLPKTLASSPEITSPSGKSGLESEQPSKPDGNTLCRGLDSNTSASVAVSSGARPPPEACSPRASTEGADWATSMPVSTQPAAAQDSQSGKKDRTPVAQGLFSDQNFNRYVSQEEVSRVQQDVDVQSRQQAEILRHIAASLNPLNLPRKLLTLRRDERAGT